VARSHALRAAYVEGRFEDALAGFRATASLRPDDRPSRVFIRRCTEFLRFGPLKDWDGTWHFDSK